MNNRRSFLRKCGIGAVGAFLWARNVLGGRKPQESQPLQNKRYGFKIVYRAMYNTVEEFVDAVLDFAERQKTYDITYTRMIFKKGYIATERRPEIVFMDNFALIWWWTSLERFPKDIEKLRNGE